MREGGRNKGRKEEGWRDGNKGRRGRESLIKDKEMWESKEEGRGRVGRKRGGMEEGEGGREGDRDKQNSGSWMLDRMIKITMIRSCS